MRHNVFADKLYLEAGNWKCRKSPNGAHYFIGDANVIQCKYCGAKKDGIPKVNDTLHQGRINAARNTRIRTYAKSNKKLQSV